MNAFWTRHTGLFLGIVLSLCAVSPAFAHNSANKQLLAQNPKGDVLEGYVKGHKKHLFASFLKHEFNGPINYVSTNNKSF
jgi:hypothetical protein